MDIKEFELKLGMTIYEDFTGNNQLSAGIYESELRKIDLKNDLIVTWDADDKKELTYRISNFNDTWFTSKKDLYLNRIRDIQKLIDTLN